MSLEMKKSSTLKKEQDQETSLIEPYGGRLVDLMIESNRKNELKEYASRLPSFQITPRSMFDMEVMATGGFSPVDRFMNRADYESVVATKRLSNGTLFPMPITLAVDTFEGLGLDREVALRGPQNELLAIMLVEEIFPWNPREEAVNVYGTEDTRHPIVFPKFQTGENP